MHVLDLGLGEAKDAEIWKFASVNACVLVTKDEDFLRLASSAESMVSVVWVRLGNCRTAALLVAFDSVLLEMLVALEAGTKLIEIR